MKFWARHFLGLELLFAATLTAGFIVWARQLGGDAVLETLLDGNRGALYGALLSLFGSLLGFVIATVAIVLGFATHERFAVLRESTQYPTLWRVFASSARWLGLATAFALIGLLLDRDSAPRTLVLYTCVGLSLVAALRVARCVWALEAIIKIATARKSGSGV